MWRGLLARLAVSGVAAIGVAATVQALRSYGWPVAGALVDPDATFTDYGPPEAEAEAEGFGNPDWITSADGAPLTAAGTGAYAGTRWDRLLAAKLDRGEHTVRAEVVHGGTRVVARFTIGKLEGRAWWLLGAAPLAAGWLFLLAGAVASLSPAPRTRAARSCAKYALVMSAFTFTILDYHTTRAFPLVFEAALAVVPFSLLGLAVTVPDAPTWLARRPCLGRALDVLALAASAIIVFFRLRGPDARAAGVALIWVFAVACLVSSGVVAVRFARARGSRRQRLGTLAISFVAVPLAGGVAALLSGLPATAAWATRINVWLVPFLFIMPAVLLVAYIKDDLWQARALLPRRPALSAVVALGLAGAVALAVMSGTALGVPFHEAIVPAVTGSALAAAVSWVAAWSARRWLPPGQAGHRRFYQELASSLAGVRDAAAVSAAVEAALRRWISFDGAEVQLTDTRAPEETARPLEATLTPAREPGALLEVPICLHGAEIGFIRVRGRRRSRAFDANDRQLLLTVAHQAALAVAFARSDSALASAQRLQTATLRQERASLIQTVAAELAAQIRHSSAVFRGFFRDAADGAGPGAGRRSGDVARATEEIVRLESLAAKLAQVTRHYLERRPTRVRDLVDRACLLVSESLAGRGLSIAVEDAAVVCCDPDSAARLVANLLANAAAATSGVAQPLIGVTWSRTEAGAELGISDNGGGFAGAAKDLFSPWSGGGARQPGLALAVAQRIAATHGWTLDARRVGGGTSFVVALPATTTRAVA